MIYISTFIAGMKDIVAERLKKEQKAKILKLSESMVVYKTAQNNRAIKDLHYINNSYVLIKTMKVHMPFAEAVNEVCKLKRLNIGANSKGSFRVIFSNENTLESVDDSLLRRIERFLSTKTNMAVSRSKPSVEFWFIKERTGCYFTKRITTKNSMKDLHKGQLRPELADIMCYLSAIKTKDLVYDPFCGYGSILTAALRYSPQKIVGCDLDSSCVDYCRQKIQNQKGISVNKCDAFDIGEETLHSVDKVITDPPWGIYAKKTDTDDFYRTFFSTMKGALKDDGRIVMLTARDIPISIIVKDVGGFTIRGTYGILVNGKKSTINVLTKERQTDELSENKTNTTPGRDHRDGAPCRRFENNKEKT